MYISDNIGDYFSRLRNAQKVGLSFTYLRNTKYTIDILTVLQEEGIIKGFSLNSSLNLIKVFLRYDNNSTFIKKIKRISKPSCRTYFSLKFLSSLNFQTGFFLLSTPFGVLTHKNALKKGVGGEVLCFIL